MIGVLVTAVLLGAPSPAPRSPWDIRVETPAPGSKTAASATIVSAPTLHDTVTGKRTAVMMQVRCDPRQGKRIAFSWPSYLGVPADRVSVAWRVGPGADVQTLGVPGAEGRVLDLSNSDSEKIFNALADDVDLVIRVTSYTDSQETRFRLGQLADLKLACPA